MDTFERRLEADHQDLAQVTHDVATEEPVLSPIVGAEQRSARRYLRPVLAALAGAAAVAVGLAVLNVTGVLGANNSSTATSEGPDHPEANIGSDSGPAGLVGPGEPCPGAVHGTLGDIALRAGVPVWTPAPASGEALTDGWTCGDTPVLMYGGDIQVSYEAGWSDVDVDKKFAALAKDYGGTVGTVLGRSALIQSAAETGDNNQVLVVVGDTLIRVLASDSVDVDRLVALADSLQLKTPATN